MTRYLIGVDEAGRAPLAGPVAVGAAMVKSGFDWSLVGGVRDSKKMTPEARSNFYLHMVRMKRAGILDFAVAYTSHTQIDHMGITAAVHDAVGRALRKIGAEPKTSNIFLDGLLHAPEEFGHQQTIIGGDDVLPVISLAAIAAKVSRDRLMTREARSYPEYGFESHKGYGTRQHYEAIQKFGLTAIHRISYCKWYPPARS